MDEFPIAIKARMQHGILREALKLHGWNQTQAANFLGISPAVFYEWVNLRRVPRTISSNLAEKLFQFTGKTYEEIWPKDVFTKAFLKAPKSIEVIRDVPVDRLLASAGMFAALPPAPDEALRLKEVQETVQRALSTLPLRQARVLRALFIDDLKAKEVAQREGTSIARINQIKRKALEVLRKGERLRWLRDLL